MNITTILIIVNVFAAVAIIALVLMQQSKGDMGSAFGGGGSSSMFGSKGSANFLSRCTSTMVTLFFVSSLTLAFIYAKRNSQEQEIAPISVEQPSEVPTVDVPVDNQASEVPTIDVPVEDSANEEVPSLETPESSVEVPVIEQEAADAVEELEAETPVILDSSN